MFSVIGLLQRHPLHVLCSFVYVSAVALPQRDRMFVILVVHFCVRTYVSAVGLPQRDRMIVCLLFS